MASPDPESRAVEAGSAEAAAWAVLRAAVRAARESRLDVGRRYGVDPAGRLAPAPDGAVVWRGDRFERAADSRSDADALLDLYLPLCRAAPLVVAHLGQSLDGHIATASGDSYYVTGPANVTHLHRMRALADAVIVGAETIARDDSRLTVRRVPGESPVRVVLDPRRRLPATRRVFCDGAAPTLLVTATDGEPRVGQAEVLRVPAADGGIDLAALVAALRARGLRSLFVEGGGKTVSAFLAAGLLDRLQIAIAPLVTGAGRRGLDLAPRDRIAECLRPARRTFAMGDDVLFDCDLRATDAAPPSSELRRIR